MAANLWWRPAPSFMAALQVRHRRSGTQPLDCEFENPYVDALVSISESNILPPESNTSSQPNLHPASSIASSSSSIPQRVSGSHGFAAHSFSGMLIENPAGPEMNNIESFIATIAPLPSTTSPSMVTLTKRLVRWFIQSAKNTSAPSCEELMFCMPLVDRRWGLGQ